MAYKGHHINEVTYLAIATMLSTINAHLQVDVRIFALQLLHDRLYWIGRIGNAKDNLKLRVLLLAKRAQAGVGFWLSPAERF